MAGKGQTKRKDKDRIVLRKGECQRKNGSYHYSWTDGLGKRHFVYAPTLEELREKEAAIDRDKMDGIKDVQVAGIPSKRYGEAVGAFIILHEGAEMTEMDVREFCDGKIARYKIPKYIFFVKEFPMTGSGKIQKFKLKDLGLELCAKNGIEII